MSRKKNLQVATRQIRRENGLDRIRRHLYRNDANWFKRQLIDVPTKNIIYEDTIPGFENTFFHKGNCDVTKG